MITAFQLTQGERLYMLVDKKREIYKYLYIHISIYLGMITEFI